MKEKLLSLKIPGVSNKLKKQGSKDSLAIEEGGTGLSRKGSISSLKSLGFSPFKHGSSSKKKEEFDTFSISEEGNESFDSNEGFGTMKKRFSRRFSSLFDSPNKIGSGSDARRHSLSTLSLTNSINSVTQGRISEAQLLQLAEEPDSDSRPVLRRDLPVCWLDQTQVRPNRPPRHEQDLLSRLYSRPFTRHILRLILAQLDVDEFKVAINVSRGWQMMLKKELDQNLLEICL